MMTFNPGDEVVVVDYPDEKSDIIGKTGIVHSFYGMYWEVDLNVAIDEETRYLLETKEIELVNNIYKYNPDQTGDTDEDI